MARKALGIDLGTTHSCVAVLNSNGVVHTIENDLGNRTTPSVVTFTSKDCFVGEVARSHALSNNTNTVYESKRLLGRRFSDSEVQQDLAHWPFKVVPGQHDRPIVEVTYKEEVKQFAPEQISALVLSKLKLIAHHYLEDCKATDAVITVPAYFTDAQRQATKDAGVIAGLNVLQVLNEPTAAGIAYGIDKAEQSENISKKFLVFDWGGGTLDVSILQVLRGQFEVLAVRGNSHLGGADFDRNLAAHFAEKFKEISGKDVSSNNRAMTRLRMAAEKAKKELSSSFETCVEVDGLHGCDDLFLNITRETFEDLNNEIFPKALELVTDCLEDAKVTRDKLDKVVLVGGTSRIPKVAAMLQEYLIGREPSKGINPDEAIAHGAAILAAVLSKQSSLPAQLKSVSLVDVTPLSLGIEIKGDRMSFVVPRNTPLPVQRKASFCTADDFQTTVNFPIYEGERVVASQNHLLGNLIFQGCVALPAGEVKFDCTFVISEEGILTVKMIDESTSTAKEVTIESGRLSREEVHAMVMEAKVFETQDREKLVLANARYGF